VADSKISDLTAITTPASASVFELLHDPAGTPVDRKITVSDLHKSLALIAYTEYSPGSNYTTTSSTLADVDATNLKLDIVAPPSGKVLVRTEFQMAPSATGNSVVGLRESTTTIATKRAGNGSPNEGYFQVNTAASFVITGLTPGSSHTYKLAFSTTAGTFYITGTTGSIVMEAYALP